MPLVYKNVVSIFLKCTLYDKIKNYFMPYEQRKYTGFDFFWRAALSSVFCMGFSTALTYPLDLIHTRTCADMTNKGKTRLFKTTFDCFNRTNLDEGRFGLYKGFELCVAQAVLRACLTLPVYNVVERQGIFKASNDSSFAGQFVGRVGASLTSGMLISLLVYPLDTAKRAYQLNGARGFNNIYADPLQAVLKMQASNGTASLYRGVSAFATSQVIFSFL